MYTRTTTHTATVATVVTMVTVRMERAQLRHIVSVPMGRQQANTSVVRATTVIPAAAIETMCSSVWLLREVMETGQPPPVQTTTESAGHTPVALDVSTAPAAGQGMPSVSVQATALVVNTSVVEVMDIPATTATSVVMGKVLWALLLVRITVLTVVTMLVHKLTVSVPAIVL